jgi:hypothetical protein
MHLARPAALAAAAALLALAPLVATATADRAAPARPARIDVTGVYQSNWNEVRLVQRGDVVTGTYVCCGGGTIEGRIFEGRVLRYRWREPHTAGRGVWHIKSPDRLEGTWGHGTDEASGGRWDLERAPEIAQ